MSSKLALNPVAMTRRLLDGGVSENDARAFVGLVAANIQAVPEQGSAQFASITTFGITLSLVARLNEDSPGTAETLLRCATIAFGDDDTRELIGQLATLTTEVFADDGDEPLKPIQPRSTEVHYPF